MAGRTMLPKVISITFAEVTPSQDMYGRSYTTNDTTNLEALLETTRDGTNLTAEAMIPVAGAILRPAAQVTHQDRILIPNGFESPRFRVVMVLEIATGQFMSSYEVVSGYTDRIGIDPFTGSFDPRMRLFFNQTTTYKNMANDVGGMGTTLEHSTQLLTPLRGWDNHHDRPDVNALAGTLRPSDVFTRLSYGAGMNEPGITQGQGGFQNQQPHQRVLSDSRVGYGARPKRSELQWNTNTHYLSSFFSAYRDTMWDPEIQGGDSQGQFTRAASLTGDPLAANDHFLNALTNETGYTQEWSVEWHELMNMDSTLEDRANVVFLQQAQQSTRWMDNESWTAVGWETDVAQMFLNLLPAVMVDLTLGLLWFSITNQTVSGRPQVTITNMAGISEFIDPSPLIDRVKQRLTGEVFTQVSNSGMLSINADVQISLTGMSRVVVSVNGGPMTPFDSAHYANSLFAPVVTADVQTLGKLAHDLGTMGGNFAARSAPPVVYHQEQHQDMVPMNSVIYQEPHVGGSPRRF